MVVVNHFPRLDHPEGGFGLGRCPSAGRGNADPNRLGTVAAGDGIALGSKKAKLLVLGKIGRLFDRTGGQAVFPFGRLYRIDGIITAPGKQGQQERKDERIRFHDTNVRKEIGKCALLANSGSVRR